MSNYMIKELKASSPSAAPRLYAETTCSFNTTTPMLKAYVSANASCEIAIKSGSKISEQCLQTGQDIV